MRDLLLVELDGFDKGGGWFSTEPACSASKAHAPCEAEGAFSKGKENKGRSKRGPVRSRGESATRHYERPAWRSSCSVVRARVPVRSKGGKSGARLASTAASRGYGGLSLQQQMKQAWLEHGSLDGRRFDEPWKDEEKRPTSFCETTNTSRLPFPPAFCCDDESAGICDRRGQSTVCLTRLYPVGTRSNKGRIS